MPRGGRPTPPRRHGTTKVQPLWRFQTVEQAQLQPLPPTAYDLALWKQGRVQRDCYVVFEQSFYSVPFRLLGALPATRCPSG